MRAEIEGILSSTEGVIMCLKQSHFSALTPTFIIITDANVITVHFSFWHYYAGFKLWRFTKTTHKCIVPYRYITGATLREGNIFSTLDIKTKDIKHSERVGVENSIIVDGLFTEHAEKLAKTIDEIIVAYQFPPPIPDPEKADIGKAMDFCKENGKKIIWVGFEDKERVAAALSIPDVMIESATLADMLDLPAEELNRFQDCVLLGYTTNSENVIAKILKLETQLGCSVVDGGLINNLPKGRSFIRCNMLVRRRERRIRPLPNVHKRDFYAYNVTSGRRRRD